VATVPKWRRPDPDLVRFIDETISGLEFDQPVAYRPMFGCPAYFTSGNLFAGVWQETLMLRLGADDRAAIAARGGRPFEPIPGRKMKEYVALPPDVVADPELTRTWLLRAAAYAASLPPRDHPRKNTR
jgi:TfoX/Sxy family transcriptional regulator of competence genes